MALKSGKKRVCLKFTTIGRWGQEKMAMDSICWTLAPRVLNCGVMRLQQAISERRLS